MTDPLELNLSGQEGAALDREVAEIALGVLARHATISSVLAGMTFGKPDIPLTASMAVLSDAAASVQAGDLRCLSDMLMAQAITLDALFAEFARRGAEKLLVGDTKAADAAVRVALKAQTQGRVTVEALAALPPANRSASGSASVDQ